MAAVEQGQTIMESLRVMMVICVLVASGAMVMGSQEVMTKLTKGFGRTLEDCKKEQNVGDHIMQDFFNFWREDYELVNRELGCMVLCMATKLGLVDADMKMHHSNAHDFAKNHGADDDLAKQLVTLVHECEKANEGVEDHCARVLETAKCFRTKIHDLKWAPSMSEVLGELMNANI